MRPSIQNIVHGLHHAITEYRRQISHAMWLRRNLTKESNPDLYMDLTDFISELRIHYKVGVGNWIQGKNKGVVSNPQKLVAMILKYLVKSVIDLARHDDSYDVILAYRAGAAAREKLAKKKAAVAKMHAVQTQFRHERDEKRRVLESEMARIAEEKVRVDKAKELARIHAEMAELEAKGEAIALARAAEIAREMLATREKFALEHKGQNLLDSWQFRGRGLEDIPREDLDLLQEIEDDLASLAEMQEEWDNQVWESSLQYEKENEY